MTNEIIVAEFNYVLNNLIKGGIGTGICDCFRDDITMLNYRTLKQILKDSNTKKKNSMWWFPLNLKGHQQRIDTVKAIILKHSM